MKNKIYDILNSHFKILSIKLNNFTQLSDESLNIELDIISEEFGEHKLLFTEASHINMKLEYREYSNSYIIIEDIAELQWQDVIYKITVSEDGIDFCCKDIFMQQI